MTLRLLHEVFACAKTINITNYKTIYFILKNDLNFFIVFIFIFFLFCYFFLVSSDIVLHVHSSSPNVKKTRSVLSRVGRRKRKTSETRELILVNFARFCDGIHRAERI